ncbi:acylphosphatase [bacterium BMS3Bbin14]|nr:acylphosphatase [bacterium BMS3Abin13]GBE53483.1 acylphosphatase [bacterium BMS3Bbin14]HDK44005.1 acylphosphatase [Desulfobacteraceae bacterium]HDZ75910.1 acylphosphatase [Desulfobacteraceae bacterium]
MTPLKRIHAIVHGQVQGVFFRDYTRRHARHLGLGGWVRNLPDGTVETVFEGEADKVEAMLAWLHEGSPHSRVSAVDAVEEEPIGEDEGFFVLY